MPGFEGTTRAGAIVNMRFSFVDVLFLFWFFFFFFARESTRRF